MPPSGDYMHYKILRKYALICFSHWHINSKIPMHIFDIVWLFYVVSLFGLVNYQYCRSIVYSIISRCRINNWCCMIIGYCITNVYCTIIVYSSIVGIVLLFDIVSLLHCKAFEYWIIICCGIIGRRSMLTGEVVSGCSPPFM